jgi:hypothetical protein
MICTLTSGIAALALVVVLATSLQPMGLVRCHVTKQLMPVACCDAVTSVSPTTTAASAPPCCCEAIALAPPALVGAATERATGMFTPVSPLPYRHIRARLDHHLHALPPYQESFVVRHRSTDTSSSRPAYDRYCSYLL